MKLRGLVGVHVGAGALDGVAVELLPFGVALVIGATGWVLAHGPTPLGGAIWWARRQGLGGLEVIAGVEAAVTARRAGEFRLPIQVWEPIGTSLRRQVAAPIPTPRAASAEALAASQELAAAGLEVVVEHGVVSGEYLGLEVARVVEGSGAAWVEVGVGRHDRAANQIVAPDAVVAMQLAHAIEVVQRRRRADAPIHPANQLVTERWLRAVVVAHPDLVAARELWPIAPVMPRPDLGARGPAPAAGVDSSGRPMLVVCSTGVDPELVPIAADARLSAGQGDRLVIALPAGDVHPLTRLLVEELRRPAEIVAVPAEWRAMLAAPPGSPAEVPLTPPVA